MTGAYLTGPRDCGPTPLTSRVHKKKSGRVLMGVFRYDSKYAAPTKEQRERYMRGEREEHVFGKNGEIVLILYDEAAYLKDDQDGVRILFTGVQDKQKVHDEVRRMLEEHGEKAGQMDEFQSQKKS
jgi:hypothetical protein